MATFISAEFPPPTTTNHKKAADPKDQLPSSSHNQDGVHSYLTHTTDEDDDDILIIPYSENHASDLESCIPEEREDDFETASEYNEPTTPIDLPHARPPTLPLTQNLAQLDGNHSKSLRLLLKPLQPVETANIPPQKRIDPQNPASTLPATPSTKRLSSLFRRSNSHQVMQVPKLIETHSGVSEGNFPKRILAVRRRSATNSALDSPYTTRSNTPPSPTHAAQVPVATSADEEPVPGSFKKNRSSTGFAHFRHKVIGRHHGKAESIASGDIRKRATSVDLQNNILDSADQDTTSTTLGHRQPWALPAQYGTGSKARRLSLNLPDDFNVDVIELHKEYADQSKLLGKRGKLVGRGATSKVSLMCRKGGASHSELYAVKEFRGKSTSEDAEEYDNKIKSEYSISKSLHHPNIVETFRLCVDHGKWNHVMEYCDAGDLFSLVKHGHLKAADRQADRLCLFKQLVQGINYLHSNGIAHRDIKLENLLITSQSKLKITDFGVSEVFSGIHPGLRSAGGQCGREMNENIRLCGPGICGSEPYIAPEVLEKAGDYDPRPLDVWSSAIVMLHLIFGGALWTRAKVNDGQIHYDKVVKGWEKFNASSGGSDNAPPITESSYPYVDAFDKMIKPPALRRMLLGMLNPNPKKRSTIAEVTKKGWMKTIECCQVDTYDDPVVLIDAGKGCGSSKTTKVVRHNHLPPHHSMGHGFFVKTSGNTYVD